MVGDSLIALIVVLADVLNYLAAGHYGVAHAVACVLPTAGLVIRRTHLYPAAGLVLLGLLLQIPFRGDLASRPSDLAVTIALYTLVAYAGRRPALLYTLAILAVGAVWTFRMSPTDLTLLDITFYLPVCWALGEWIGARRAYNAEVEQRLRLLEFERDQQARLAVAEERNRIAREIHDVLAHSVSVMITQADGATYALRKNPDLASQALDAISSTGRDALTELRTLLEVLRNPDEATDRTPQPTAAGLRQLSERVEALGLPVDLRITGDFESLPAGLGLGVYRIVQESLTNALKHGSRHPATVQADNDGEHIEIEILNEAPGDASPLDAEEPLVTGGNGLIGMRERATVYGGCLEAGPAEGGGWRVFARLPVSNGVHG